MTFTSLIRQPSALMPLAMSVAAFILIFAAVNGWVTTGGTQPHDEGTPARIFQMLLLLQVPFAAYFAVKWLPRAFGTAALVLLLQVVAALAAVATIVWIER